MAHAAPVAAGMADCREAWVKALIEVAETLALFAEPKA